MKDQRRRNHGNQVQTRRLCRLRLRIKLDNVAFALIVRDEIVKMSGDEGKRHETAYGRWRLYVGQEGDGKTSAAEMSRNTSAHAEIIISSGLYAKRIRKVMGNVHAACRTSDLPRRKCESTADREATLEL
ncbi:hypothetical protein F2P81_024955 [Scophthalmus maximus]|uniref:Uncharacterized protein n=1 Tax=Scophthalmus maximus TaxID=52904 RepID=A0A6A4RWZ3_SCOMX|nr:hypothetical protein F2P81_024955 [Scophthalmus maximus]